MKLFVSLIFLLSITAAFGFSLEGPDAYCRQNPRRTGETIALNRPAFSWLLTCPSGAPLASPININFTEVGELDLSYYNRNSPSRRDQEVLLFESAFTNGAIDPRQGACISWEHAFKPNSKAFILSTGSGLPVIVSLDRRYYDGPTESETIRGSFLYSRCNDAACTSATTPKPFWGRRIGEPLFQDTMAELAYFPIDPDWAYNSPVLGAVGTLDRRENMLSKVHRAREGFDSLPGDYPSDIAHTHVWSATGEKILVVVAPGIRDLNKTGADWYLTWCQEEDCDSWGIMKLKHPVKDPEQNRKQDFNDLQTSRFFEDVNQEQDLHSRAAVTTSADGRSIIVSIGGYVQEYKLRSLHANPRFRYEAMQSIYSEMTRPRLMNPRAPRSENDINEQNFYFGVDFAIWDGLTFEDYHPLNAAYGGRGNEFLNLLSEPIQNRFAVGCADLEEYGIHADPWCTWNYYWEQTMSVSCGNSTDSGRLAGKGHADLVTDCNTGDVYLLASPFGDATNDYNDPIVRNTRIRQSSYMTVVPVSPKNGICGAPVEEWPKVTTDLTIGKRSEYHESEIDVMVYPTPSRRPSGYLKPSENTLRPVQGLDLAHNFDSPGRGVWVGDAETGRRFNAVQGGNGLPFFTWADLNAGLQDAAQVWGTCAFESTNTFSCRTIFDSIELGTMGFLPGLNGRTILLQAPDKLPVMVYWFDHFGGYSNGAMADASLPIAPGQVTNKPLIIACTDYRCDSASVSAFTPSQMADIANLHWDGTHTNYVINGDAAFVGDNLYLVMNEGGARDEAANNPIRLWWTNRWASPTGMPCGPSNSGEQVIADDVVYYCSRLRIGSEEAELYTGTIPRPWTKLYEWVKMDWGFGLRNLGGFLGWGAATGDRAYLDIAAERDPFWTQNSGDYLDGQTAYVRPNGKSEDNQNGDIKFF